MRSNIAIDTYPITARWNLLARFYLFGLLLLSSFFPDPAWAKDADPTQPPSGPWFTGTLLSTRGSTVDQGHLVVEPYFCVTRFGGLYNNNWRLQSASTSSSYVQQTYFIYGLTSRMDIEYAPQWLGNYSQHESSTGFGDFPLQLGFQVMTRSRRPWNTSGMNMSGSSPDHGSACVEETHRILRSRGRPLLIYVSLRDSLNGSRAP